MVLGLGLLGFRLPARRQPAFAGASGRRTAHSKRLGFKTLQGSGKDELSKFWALPWPVKPWVIFVTQQSRRICDRCAHDRSYPKGPSLRARCSVLHTGLSQNYGYFFVGPTDEDHSILGSILVSLHLGKLPYQ